MIHPGNTSLKNWCFFLRGDVLSGSPVSARGLRYSGSEDHVALGGPIYAGTNEIQRNIIAERLLGLPREAKGSKGAAK